MSISLRVRTALLACLAFALFTTITPIAANAGPVPPPETTITSGPSDDRLTTDRTPTFHFVSSISGSTFECRVDGGSWFACTSPYTTAPLADGWHLFEVRATSPAMVTDPTPASRSFKVDHDFVPDTELTSGPGHGSTTSDDTPTFEFRATTGDHALAYPYGPATTFTCSIDAGAWFACSSPYTTPSLADGLHTFAVRATRDGRTDPTPASRTFTVDRGIPDTSITGGPTEGSVTSDPTPTFSFTSTRAGSTFTCSVDGAAPSACSSPVTTGVLADGTHTFAVSATAGGSTDPSPALRTFVIDTPDRAAAGSPPPSGAAAPLPASRVSIVSVAGRIGATGATRIVLRCSAGSGECTGRLRLTKTIRFRCGERFCFLRKSLGSRAFMIPSGSRLGVTPQLTNEAIRLVRRAALDRLLVLATADSVANDARRAIVLIGRRPA